MLENQTFGESSSLGTPPTTATTSGTVIHKMEDCLTKVIEGKTGNKVSISLTSLKGLLCTKQLQQFFTFLCHNTCSNLVKGRENLPQINGTLS